MTGLLLPTTCAVCGRAGPSPCPGCWAALRPAPLAPAPGGVAVCLALLAYEGAGRELVARLKYRNQRGALPWLATGLAALLEAEPLAATDPPPQLCWAPTTGPRRRRRGFDQAELLARATAAELGWPCRSLLTRLPGPAQTGRSAAERRGGPSFVARGLSAATVSVVDDVVTSGSTLSAAARALHAAGAGLVIGVTAARTPASPRSP